MTHQRTYRYEHQRRTAAMVAAAEAARQAEAHRAACGQARPHAWPNWEYTADYTRETRTCRDCGATETREVRL